MLEWDTIQAEWLRTSRDAEGEAADPELQIPPLVAIVLLIGDGALALGRWTIVRAGALLRRAARTPRSVVVSHAPVERPRLRTPS